MPVCITCPLNRSSSSPQSKAAADETICCISQYCKRKDAYSRECLAITYHIPSQVGSVPVPSQVGSVSVCVCVCVCVCARARAWEKATRKIKRNLVHTIMAQKAHQLHISIFRSGPPTSILDLLTALQQCAALDLVRTIDI